MKKILIIILSGIALIPILLLSLCNESCRIKVWYQLNDYTISYEKLPNNKINQLFTLCVNFLLIVAERLNMTYNEVNIWIFCIIWPIVTMLSLIANVLLI